MMAWNEIPAKDDPKFCLQAYYARLNVLTQFLSPLSAQMFDVSWRAISDSELQDTRRAALVGEMVGVLVQTLGLEEVEDIEVPVGGWFVHSGVTAYGKGGERSAATISLASGKVLRGSIREDCIITQSARSNMVDQDDVSFVLGRRTSAEKFDLVAAGYRDPFAHFHGTDRHVNLLRRDPFGPDRRESFLPALVPSAQMSGLSDEAVLAYAAKDVIEWFARSVEREGAWKMLYDGAGNTLHETRHQALFRCFSQLTFAALGIGIHPNADHGRGPTDFTLSLREARHVVEFKKDTDVAKIIHGLTVQLPLYMDSARASYGSFVVMCHERNKAEVEAAMTGKNDLQFVIDTYAIDCRPQRSASKA